MSKFILNEKELCENALSYRELCGSLSESVTHMTKYYYNLGNKKSDVIRKVNEYLVMCSPFINLSEVRPLVESKARKLKDAPLIDMSGVPVTQKELDTIATLDTVHKKKVAFTLLCVAKYGDASGLSSNGWVNTPLSEVFRLANVVIDRNRQRSLIHDLYKTGYVDISRRVDSASIRVLFIDDYSDPVMTITDFRNVGSQYLMCIGEPYIRCIECGLVVRRPCDLGRKKKYCKNCASQVIVNQKNRYRSSLMS